MSTMFTVGQTVTWHSVKGYTPPEGEQGTIDCVWEDKRMVRLTLTLSAEEAAAHPEFNGLCSMCATFDELTHA